ncbi:alpha/beta fold hydrolase [uncultured Faecalicoccus sp.]|uniref:alpha/beta fold hydrolase n=1 Tax=uncultured Faecalicoccus sp. TaxID=1971760 RepID=UPI0025E29496|nr:alpha/beta fold hydrolase [uncultured Faecalicoccus sp.]
MKEMEFKLLINGQSLDIYQINPAQKIKGIVVIVHGMAEHKERYAKLMRALAQDGWVALIYDQRGHGRSVKSLEDLGYMDDHHAQKLVRDLAEIVTYAKGQAPNKPVILLGHSMGTLVARLYLKKYDDTISKLVLSGAVASNPLAIAGSGLAILLEKIHGSRYRSALIQKMALGAYDTKCPGQGKNHWLSVNEENVKAYNEEPLDGFTFTLNGFLNLFWMIRHTYDRKGWQVKNPDIKILFLAGEEDPVIGSVKKWQKAQKALCQVGYRFVSGKLYLHMRHEIFQEKEAQQVIEDLLTFINE